MGGKRKYNHFAQKKRERKEQAANPESKKDKRSRPYADIVKENESFEKYYKEQNICPPEEWDLFMKKLRKGLPTAFRITGSKGESKALLDIVKGELFTEILNVKLDKEGDQEMSEEEEEAKKPHCFPWYPGGLAWQLQITRTDIRRSEAYYRLHNFLTAETSCGSISRQEAVSMIPPIVLQVEPHHKVLDMCASPGSKTAQLIEFLHAEEGKIPTGFVMANDVDNNRCYMLVHQAKRLNSPCILITNHDAGFLPHLRISSNFMEDPVSANGKNDKESDVNSTSDNKPDENSESAQKDDENAAKKNVAISDRELDENSESAQKDDENAAQKNVATSDNKPDENSESAQKDDENAAKKNVATSDKEPDENSESAQKDNENAAQKNVATRLLKFDRILCDVPCSGDGTLRKNADIWMKWSAGHANNLHGVQYRIGHRGAELLKVGGKLTYSTCSLNPVENEAVILRLLREAKGSLQLAEISHLLPGLVFSKGISKWRMASKDMEFYDKFEDVPEKYHTMLRPQMFPPTPEEAEQFHLDRCIRILPHHQDTGGFFVAVLEKVAPLPFEKKEKIPTDLSESSSSEKPNEVLAPWGPQRKRRKLGGYKEDPYVFFSGESEDVYPSIKEFYNLDKFNPECLLTRCHMGKKKNLYLVSPVVRDVVKLNEHHVKIINTGVKTFVRCDNKNMACAFRLSQEGLASVLPNIGKDRKVSLTKKDLVTLLLNDNPHSQPPINTLSPETQAQVKDLSNGSCVLVYNMDGLKLELVGWRGSHSLRAYMARPDTVHMLRLLREDISKFDVNKFKKVDENASVDGNEELENTIDENETESVIDLKDGAEE